ncbi:MAG: insulinase family protein [Planctomycetes bacterium]|nr:insulinase family protein [Planctomycetota bacterium]
MPAPLRRALIGLVSCCLAGLLPPAAAHAWQPAAAIPARPEEIEFSPLDFKPPEAARFRRTLPDGTVVYVAPSHEFPLVTLSITFKGGASLDPADVPGLVASAARLVREGGTTTRKPAEVDEALDFLATEIGVASGDAFTTATMNCLANTFDESLGLFVDMLRNPGFDAARLETAKARQIAALKQRNDDASSIVGREWRRLLWGPDHFEGREPTAASVAATTRERMADVHRRIFHPGNMIVSVSGDFDEQDMLARLAKAFAGWQKGPAVPDPVAPTAQLVPGVYHVPKDIPQGKVVIGMRSISRDDPDAIPLAILNDILGGSGFTSRIMQQVRSNEGLAYSAASAVAPKVYYPGQFQARFESKNPTVALATKIVMDLIAQVREEPVSYEELETAKLAAVETFPRQFESKPAMLRLFVNDEWTNRPPGYWQSYRDKVSAVTREDLQRVARKHLDPEKMAILVVGDWDAIAGGDLERRATMKDFFGGRVTHLPLRDPLSLEPLPEGGETPK